MACDKQNDGRVVSERIINATTTDSTLIAREITSLDSSISPEIFGRDFGRVLVEYIERGDSINVGALNHKIALVRKIYSQLEGERNAARIINGIKSYENGLPMERRMKLYACIATPQQMGTALRIDSFSADADSALIEAQKKALRAIYTDDQWSRFIEYYNRK